MVRSETIGKKVFITVNVIILTGLALMCILPFVNLLAISFSHKFPVATGQVTLWPKQFTLASYIFAFKSNQILWSFGISVVRVIVSVILSLFITILSAFPLSKTAEKLRFKGLYIWIYLVPMLFSGGIVPLYIVISKLKLMNNFWVLVLPSAVQVFNIVLLMNFFRAIPYEIEEAARIDGAGHVNILKNIYLPLSVPALATLVLFIFVGSWNSWFDGLIFMNSDNAPLQTYLYTLMQGFDPTNINGSQIGLLEEVNENTQRAALVIISMIPIAAIYPVIQKFFKTGIVLGGVKG